MFLKHIPRSMNSYEQLRSSTFEGMFTLSPAGGGESSAIDIISKITYAAKTSQLRHLLQWMVFGPVFLSLSTQNLFLWWQIICRCSGNGAMPQMVHHNSMLDSGG